MSQWKKQQSSGPGDDPLSNQHGQPILGDQGRDAQYKGRVIIELWETSQSDQVAFSVDPVTVDAEGLLKRASAALSTRLQKGQWHP